MLVRPNRTIAGVGYNGFPRHCDDLDGEMVDRELKYARTIHAEQNAILNAEERCAGYSIYISKPSPYGPTCDRCACIIIQAGITRVVYRVADNDFAERWRESYGRAMALYKEARVDVIGVYSKTDVAS